MKGNKNFGAMGVLGGQVTRETRGHEHLQRIGVRGGAATAAKGSDYYRAIGKRGHKAREVAIRNAALEEAAALVLDVAGHWPLAERIRALKDKAP